MTLVLRVRAPTPLQSPQVSRPTALADAAVQFFIIVCFLCFFLPRLLLECVRQVCRGNREFSSHWLKQKRSVSNSCYAPAEGRWRLRSSWSQMAVVILSTAGHWARKKGRPEALVPLEGLAQKWHTSLLPAHWLASHVAPRSGRGWECPDLCSRR